MIQQSSYIGSIDDQPGREALGQSPGCNDLGTRKLGVDGREQVTAANLAGTSIDAFSEQRQPAFRQASIPVFA